MSSNFPPLSRRTLNFPTSDQNCSPQITLYDHRWTCEKCATSLLTQVPTERWITSPPQSIATTSEQLYTNESQLVYWITHCTGLRIGCGVPTQRHGALTQPCARPPIQKQVSQRLITSPERFSRHPCSGSSSSNL